MEEEGGQMKGFVDQISEKFESLETQKKSLRKSIFSVFFEWKGFEEQIVSTQNCCRQGLSQLESKEKELRSVQDSLTQIIKELDSERDSLKKKVQQVEGKEKEFKLFYDRGIMKLNKERDDFRKEVEFRDANFLQREKTLEDLLTKQEIQRDEIEAKEAKIKKLNRESEDFLKEIEFSKDEISESMKEIERRRVEIEGKEANIMKLNKERDDFLKEIEFVKGNLEIQKGEISESMNEMERRKEEIEGKEEEVMKREKKVEAKEKEMELLIEKQREVDLRVKDVDLMIEDIVFKEKDVELIRVLNEKRSKELDMLEKKLGAKVKDVELTRDLNEKRSKVLDMWDKQFGAKVKDVELSRDLNKKCSKELDTRKKQLGTKVKDVELIRYTNEGRSKELDMREEQLGAKVKDVESIRDMNEGRSKELDMREEQLSAKVKDVELIRDMNEGRSKELDMMEEQLSAKVKDVELIKDLNEGRSKELDIWEKQLGEKDMWLQVSIQKMEEQINKHSKVKNNLDSSDLKQNECHLGKNLQRQQVNEGHHASVEEVAVEESAGRQTREENRDCNHLTMKKSHLDGQLNDEHHASVKEAAAKVPKEMQLHKRIHEENCNDNHLKKKGSRLEKEKTPSFVGKGIREEGYDLYKFLQDHGKEFNKVVDHVIQTIEQSKEPAKLVLTAIEEFYNRVIGEKETEYKKDIAFRNCILLSEQLMKISVDSRLSSVKDEALKFARVWRSNMKIRDSFEVLGFLYLLASYKLADAFPIDAVIRFLEVVAPRRKTRDLCRHLDLKNNIHDLITELIKKNQFLLAFDYVHELGLVDVFPPVALLKRHVLYSSKEAKKTVNKGKKGKKNPEAEDKALSIEISALKDVMRCITRRSLEAEYPPDEVNERIDFLERQREALKASPENQKADSYGSSNTQHDNTNCLSKKKQKKRCLDHDGEYNKSELPPPSKCPRHVSPPEVNHSEGHQSGKAASRHPDDTTSHTDPYSQQQQQQHNQSPRHVPPPSEGHLSGKPSSHHFDHTTFHTVPYSSSWQQQHQQNQSPAPPPSEGHRSGIPPSRHPDDTTFPTDPYRWQQQQQHNPDAYAPTRLQQHHHPQNQQQQHHHPQHQQQQHHHSDPPCHMNNLVSRYPTAGNRGSMYPANHFTYLQQPASVQSVIMAPPPRPSFYPANPRYI